ncbi:MAG TPA: hypothetical protein VG869_10875, partial [Acidimicrobiia bacterium]|nr:hypothetical protein [Acidimicrobiia bacterium]
MHEGFDGLAGDSGLCRHAQARGPARELAAELAPGGRIPTAAFEQCRSLLLGEGKLVSSDNSEEAIRDPTEQPGRPHSAAEHYAAPSGDEREDLGDQGVALLAPPEV